MTEVDFVVGQFVIGGVIAFGLGVLVGARDTAFRLTGFAIIAVAICVAAWAFWSV